MNRLISLILILILAGAGSAVAKSDKSGKSKKSHKHGSMFVVEGFAAANSYSGAMPAMFADWCDGVCFPTVTLEAVDVKHTRHLGWVHAWGKEFAGAGDTIQFKEFILYEFKGGQLYTVSEDGGHPAGAFTDPTLVPPKFGAVVLVGGAEGSVVGGTGKYKKAGGAYSTRLKVEDDGAGNFFYYDELYFRFREVDIK
jgi:hypothetical protein